MQSVYTVLRIACLSLLCATTAAPAPKLQLARELAEEGDGEACLVECKRIDVTHPECRPAVNELHALVARRPADGHTGPWWRRVGALPIRGLVAFYRFIVAPAIGTRCVLHPSCSAYSLQAARERGWLGIPMTADRLIREPTVVHAREHPVVMADGRIHYADPISDHIGE